MLGNNTLPAGAGASSLENGRGGASFINKPARGWLHPDQQIAKEGIHYAVRYIGCLEVKTSMKSLDFDTRSQIAKECINQVCEAAGLKTVDKRRKVDRRIQHILGSKPILEYAGTNVSLVITSSSLRLSVLETGRVIANHDMPNISFASGGDTDTLDFVAYVAKDVLYGRACFVLECGGGIAQDVITTIGQAFELRFKEYMKRAPRTGVSQDRSESSNTAPRDDPEYYNDLPGKVPPDLPVGNGKVHHTNAGNHNMEAAPTVKPDVVERDQIGVSLGNSTNKESVGNLIDLNAEGLPPPSQMCVTVLTDHEYVNDSILEEHLRSRTTTGTSKDPFDMYPFNTSIPAMSPPPLPQKLTPAAQKAQLLKEEWFQGPVSRREAEALLLQDGDFLVRESQGSPGQYVLTGVQHQIKKHLLLVDPEGIVRTKDRTFDSVSHLINYHRDNGLPIISAESALVLRHPVPKSRRPVFN